MLSYVRILNINRVKMQVGQSTDVVEDRLANEVVALALEILVREEVTRADYEQFT